MELDLSLFPHLCSYTMALLDTKDRRHLFVTPWYGLWTINGFLSWQVVLEPCRARARICNRLWSPGIDTEKSIPPDYVARRAGTKIGLSYRAGIFKKSMGARHRLGIGLSYRPVRLHRLAELMPWHRFLGSIKV
jgi:hypothetical protein